MTDKYGMLRCGFSKTRIFQVCWVYFRYTVILHQGMQQKLNGLDME